MHRKVKKIIIASCALMVLASCTCNRSYFQMLTHNGVGYWRTEKTIASIRGYSIKDSTFGYYDENLMLERDMCGRAVYEHRFHISNDTLYQYFRDRETGNCSTESTHKICSFNKNKIRVIYIPTEWEKANFDCSNIDTITFVRVKNRDIKRLRKGKKVTYKDCKDGGYKIVVKILDRNDRKRQEKNSQEE